MSLSNFKIPIEIKSKIKFPGRQLRVRLGQIIFIELMPFRLWMKGTFGRKENNCLYFTHSDYQMDNTTEREKSPQTWDAKYTGWLIYFVYTSEFLFSDL